MTSVLTRRPETWPESWIDREFGRMMRSLWGNGDRPEFSGATAFYPVDVWEDDDSVHVEAELPGFTKEEIDITLEQGMLQITATRQVEERKGSELLRERRFTRYHRGFNLPTAVDDSRVDAKFDNGVLHLTLPKAEEVKPRRIKVQ